MKPYRPMRARRAVLALGACGLASTAAAAPAASQDKTTSSAAKAAGPTAAPASAQRTGSKVVLGKRSLNVPVGRAAWIRGRVQARSPQLVRLQRLTPGGRWVTLDSDRLDERGRFRLSHRPEDSGSQRVRVRYSGDQVNLRATRNAGRLNAFREAQASWYGPGFYGRTTACGQTFSADVMGVAHKSLPCGTELTLRKGGRTARVRVIDRGPFVGGREFDLSPAVKSALRFGSTGSVGTTS